MSASAPSGLLLAIESSQREASVALRDAAGVVHEEPLAASKRHDDDLMPAIDRLFRSAELVAGDLRGGAVGVSIGPGGFTGLRIATATAKMFAEALGTRLVAVPSALVAAETTLGDLPQAPLASVALACKGESFWLTRLARDAAGVWRIVGEPGIATAQTLRVEADEFVLADAFFPEPARALASKMSAQVMPPRFAASACLTLASRMLERGETVDPLRLLPLYPRQPEAVTLWEQRQRHQAG